MDAAHSTLLRDMQRWRLHTSHGRTEHSSEDQFDTWSAQAPAQQLEEASIYLLIWGEAANLRFMPELIYFLAELAMRHIRRTPAPDDAPPHSFLERVVVPIYGCVFKETFSGLVKGRPASKSASALRPCLCLGFVPAPPCLVKLCNPASGSLNLLPCEVICNPASGSLNLLPCEGICIPASGSLSLLPCEVICNPASGRTQ